MDCKVNRPTDPNFQIVNFVSTDNPDDDDTIPEDDEILSYLEAVESGHLNCFRPGVAMTLCLVLMRLLHLNMRRCGRIQEISFYDILANVYVTSGRV